jgi:3-hydroxyacyl-CoA dehydrogenase
MARDPSPGIVHRVMRGSVLWLIAKHAGVSTLSARIRRDLARGVAEGAADPDVRAMVIACDGTSFFVGADLHELQTGLKSPGLDALVRACEATEKPVVSAMHARAFGGGVVVALASDARIATRDTIFAMPEVELGLLPTFGGTQYLPRLIGVQAAVDLVTDATRVSAAHALAIGLVDRVVPDEAIRQAAQSLAESLPHKRRVRDEVRHAVGAATLARLFEAKRAQLRVRCSGFVAPFACLDVMQRGLALPLPEALRLEHAEFERLLASDQSRRLRTLFFAERRLRRCSFDRTAVSREILAAAGSGPTLARLGTTLLGRRVLPDLDVFDALVVEVLGLERHAPSVLGLPA